MDEDFLAALFPGAHRILGYRLQPYCAGHLATLAIYGSPLVTSGATVTGGELIRALRICAKPGFPFPLAGQVRARFWDRVKGWWVGRDPRRLRAKVTAFRAYQQAHYSFPSFYVQGEGDENRPPETRPLSAPFLLARVLTLTARGRLSYSEAWRLPFALSSWIIGTLDELEGRPVRFLYEGDENDDDLPPAVEDMDEATIYEQAVRTMGEEFANRWRAARQQQK